MKKYHEITIERLGIKAYLLRLRRRDGKMLVRQIRTDVASMHFFQCKNQDDDHWHIAYSPVAYIRFWRSNICCFTIASESQQLLFHSRPLKYINYK